MRLSNRFRAAVFGLSSIIACLPAVQMAHAGCGTGKLGTSRTITLDPARHKTFVGHEKSLGLRHKEVILTFDDGPLGARTSSILDTLKDHCVKATFFYVGKMATSQPALVRRVVREGHTLGHHTWGHNRMVSYSSKRAGAFLDKGIATLDKIAYGRATGRAKVPFFRYPYLAHNKRTDKVVASRGLIAFDANIDSLDWKLKSANAIHDRIMRRLRQDGKGIVLMHDIHARTAKMLPRLLKSLKAGGYKVVHIVPKGSAVPAIEPQLVAAKKPAAAAVRVAHLEKAGQDKTDAKREPARKASSIIHLGERGADQKPSRQTPASRLRSGVVSVSAPAKAARSGKKRRAEKRKVVRVASARPAKARKIGKRRGNWTLRSSHWIIN